MARFLAFGLLAGLTCTPALADVPQAASAEVRRLTEWTVATGDAAGRPFVIVDKKEARVFAFHASGLPLGSTPALLGLARGDDNVPGIGSMRLAQITAAQRITPAGRFEARLGTNIGGHRILWVDYEAALSLHPVVTSNPAERRAQRLATASVIDNRISYGCINVPADFYAKVIEPLFEATDGIVYILPEVRPLTELFDISSTAPKAP
jgi:hypothetical protein